MPKAIGSAPSIAAIVVIRIGRKRSRQASWIAASGVSPRVRSATRAKSIIMIAFFFTMPMRRMTPMSAMIVNSVLAQHQRQRRPEPGRRQRREDRQRMNQALVQNSQNDVDRQQGGEDQPGLTRER